MTWTLDGIIFKKWYRPAAQNNSFHHLSEGLQWSWKGLLEALVSIQPPPFHKSWIYPSIALNICIHLTVFFKLHYFGINWNWIESYFAWPEKVNILPKWWLPWWYFCRARILYYKKTQPPRKHTSKMFEKEPKKDVEPQLTYHPKITWFFYGRIPENSCLIKKLLTTIIHQ